MSHLIHGLDILTRDPQATLYSLQALTYTMAFHTMRSETHHPPGMVYLISGVLHLALALLHRLSHG